MIKPKMNADTKVTIVMWVFISSTQRHLTAVSAGGPFPKATRLPVSAIRHGSAHAQSGEGGTIEAASV